MSCLIDIYEYINSRDVRSYLRELDYQFTTPEAALIIYYCEHITLQQKFELWTRIIREMPDCSLEGTWCRKPIDSFHEFLLEYIGIQKKKIELSFMENDKAIYEYYVEYSNNIGAEKSIFTMQNLNFNVWDSKEMFEKDLQKSLKNGFEIKWIYRICFWKRWTNNSTATIEMNSNMEIMKIDSPHNTKRARCDSWENNLLTKEEFEIDDMFEMMYFYFPTPFKKGDILCDYKTAACAMGNAINLNDLYGKENVFVLAETIKRDHQSFDGADVDYFPYGYYFQFYNRFEYLKKDCIYINYLNLERLKVLPNDKGILLNTLGECLKGDLGKEEFINLYNKYLEDSCNSKLYSSDWVYQIKGR